MEEDQNIGLLLKTISDKIRQIGDAAFAKFGLTGPQVMYLMEVREAGGVISQRELEKKSGVSHPTIVGIMARLQDKGFVRVEISQKDRRHRIISLTEQAQNVMDELKKGSKEMNTLLVTGMTDEEKRELRRLLELIDRNVDVTLKKKGE